MWSFTRVRGLFPAPSSKYAARAQLCSRLTDSVTLRHSGSVGRGATSSQDLFKLFPLQTALQHFEVSNRRLLEALETIMSNPTELQALCLSADEDDTASAVSLELLLENYHALLSDVLIKTTQLAHSLKSQQDIMEVELSNHRNELIAFNVRCVCVCVCVCVRCVCVCALCVCGRCMQSPVSQCPPFLSSSS